MLKEKEQYLSTLFKTLKMTAKIYFFELQSKKNDGVERVKC